MSKPKVAGTRHCPHCETRVLALEEHCPACRVRFDAPVAPKKPAPTGAPGSFTASYRIGAAVGIALASMAITLWRLGPTTLGLAVAVAGMVPAVAVFFAVRALRSRRPQS